MELCQYILLFFLNMNACRTLKLEWTKWKSVGLLCLCFLVKTVSLNHADVGGKCQQLQKPSYGDCLQRENFQLQLVLRENYPASPLQTMENSVEKSTSYFLYFLNERESKIFCSCCYSAWSEYVLNILHQVCSFNWSISNRLG